MHEIFAKYESLCKDGQWDTNPKKDVKIVALTSHILELKIPFTKKSASQESNKDINGDQKSFNNDGRSWKTIAPTYGESWTEKKPAHLALVKMAQILDRNTQLNISLMKNNTSTYKTNSTKFSNKSSLKIISIYMKSNSMTKKQNSYERIRRDNLSHCIRKNWQNLQRKYVTL